MVEKDQPRQLGGLLSSMLAFPLKKAQWSEAIPDGGVSSMVLVNFCFGDNQVLSIYSAGIARVNISARSRINSVGQCG